VPENPRLHELRRRVEKDPASIAFAQLAEEHRRAGELDDAIRVARTGLDRHPGYLSARVTLGRALLERGAYQEAQTELECVIHAAPDNLAAIRALAEIHQRREDGSGGQGPRIEDPCLIELESWLAAILADREQRRSHGPS
jgi:predicted Zn-dependent protease